MRLKRRSLGALLRDDVALHDLDPIGPEDVHEVDRLVDAAAGQCARREHRSGPREGAPRDATRGRSVEGADGHGGRGAPAAADLDMMTNSSGRIGRRRARLPPAKRDL